jgi:hypothetical protein
MCLNKEGHRPSGRRPIISLFAAEAKFANEPQQQTNVKNIPSLSTFPGIGGNFANL